MGSNARLGILILAVQDLQRSLAFYRAAFGWEQTVDESVYAEFAIGAQQRLGLYQRDAFGRCTGQAPLGVGEGELAGTELYFFSDDLTANIRSVEAAGARRLSPLQVRDWGDEAAYFADPDGNVLVLARTLKKQNC